MSVVTLPPMPKLVSRLPSALKRARDKIGERAADHHDLAVGLQRHAGAVAAERAARGLAADAEGRIEAVRRRGAVDIVVADRQNRGGLRPDPAAQPPGCDRARTTVLVDLVDRNPASTAERRRASAPVSPSAKNTVAAHRRVVLCPATAEPVAPVPERGRVHGAAGFRPVRVIRTEDAAPTSVRRPSNAAATELQHAGRSVRPRARNASRRIEQCWRRR